MGYENIRGNARLTINRIETFTIFSDIDICILKKLGEKQEHLTLIAVENC